VDKLKKHIMSEGIGGMFYYHISRVGEEHRGLCGKQTMPTHIPLSIWGYRGHLNERYCQECRLLAHDDHIGALAVSGTTGRAIAIKAATEQADKKGRG